MGAGPGAKVAYHMPKSEDERSPPVRHMFATVAFGEPGAVEEWMAYLGAGIGHNIR